MSQLAPPFPPLESHAVQVTACCSHAGAAQSCGRRALPTAHVPRRVATPSRDDPVIWSRFGEAQVDLFASPSPPTASCTSPWPRAPPLAQTHWHTQLASGLMQVCVSPVSLLAQTLCKLREDEEQVLLVAPHWPTRTWFPNSFPSRQHLHGAFLWGRTSFLRARHHMAPAVQIYGTSMCGSWTGRGRLEWSTTGGGRDHHSG